MGMFKPNWNGFEMIKKILILLFYSLLERVVALNECFVI